MARLTARTIVDAGLAAECEVGISYAIGKADPVAFEVDTLGTGEYADHILTTLRTSRMSHKVTTLARHHSRALVWSHNHIPRRSFVSLWAGGRRRSRWDKPECNVYPG